MARSFQYFKKMKEQLMPDGKPTDAMMWFYDGLKLTPEKAAAQLGVTAKTVRHWLRTGRLPGLKVVDEWFIDPRDLEAFRQPTTADVANELGVSQKTIRKRLRDGRIGGQKQGKKWRVEDDPAFWKKQDYRLRLSDGQVKVVSGYKLWPPDPESSADCSGWVNSPFFDELGRALELSVYVSSKRRIVVHLIGKGIPQGTIQEFPSVDSFAESYQATTDQPAGRLPFDHPVFSRAAKVLRVSPKP